MSSRERQRAGSAAGPTTAVGASTTSRLEREVKEVRGENVRLKEELSTIKSLYDQLVFEAPREQFNERRVHLLKSQVSFLERQIAVQNQALQSRAQSLTDLAALLDYILEHGRRMDDTLCKEEGEEGGGDKVGRKNPRNCGFDGVALDTLLDKSRSMRARISRCSHMYSPPTPPSRPHLPSSLSSGRACGQCQCGGYAVNQLNLKYVSGLESELARLYGNLTELHSSLRSFPSLPSPRPSPSLPSSPSLLAPLTSHYLNLVKTTSDVLADCCHHLLTLSLLSPPCTSLPLPNTRQSTLSGIDSLPSRLKPHVKNRAEVKLYEVVTEQLWFNNDIHDASIAQEVVKAVKHTELLQQQKISALEREVHFHKSVYQLQVNYVSSLFEAVRSGYETFEEASQELIRAPLEDILLSFSELNSSSEEGSVREFFRKFQEREKSLRNVVESLKPGHRNKHSRDSLDPQGAAALSAFGEQFFERLHQLEQECRQKTHSESQNEH